jgi:hypothetical protein
MLGNSGCLGLAIGGAAAAGVAGAVYYARGQLYRDYPASLDNSTVAVKTALNEMQLPVVGEKSDAGEVEIESRTGDGDPISIKLSTVTNRVPADPATTHISVRVGKFGDESLSTRLLDRISLHLEAPVQMRPVPSGPAPAPAPAPTPSPAATTSASLPPGPQTVQPPLAK